ncbi:MAG: hypothetical protein ACRC8Y_10130 [Chroococcales cyanobacterium]
MQWIVLKTRLSQISAGEDQAIAVSPDPRPLPVPSDPNRAPGAIVATFVQFL